MFCCPRCFEDSFLTAKITREQVAVGHCDFCGTLDQPLAPPESLRDDFETVFTAYEESPRGVVPGTVLSNEWHLSLNEAIVNPDALLDAIMGSGFSQKTFLIESPTGQIKVQQWEDFRLELKHRYRFLPENGPDLNQLEELLEYLVEELEPTDYFRARIQSNEAYSVREMGMPPIDLCGNGRANPAGIPFLYVASDHKTALAEIRPHPGDRVSIGKFMLNKRKALVDLRDPRGSITPFGKDENALRGLRQDLALLQKLSDDLSKPYQPRMAHLEYLPTQYLCEFIKKVGYYGVVYRSAVGTGTNYVLFTNDDFECVSVSSVLVTAIEVTAS